MTTRSAPPVIPAAGASGLVARPRLLALLEDAAPGAITLLSAPPGSGKTMLVRSWLAERPEPTPVAWVDVQRDETDSAHFWGQVLDAVRDSRVVPPDSALATLVPTAHAEPGDISGRLATGLREVDGGLVLVLDDVQHLRSADLLAGLERLVVDVPPTIRVVLMSRRDPALGLHRLRLAGRLVEIRAADLEFTEAEAADLFAGAGIAIPPDDVARLHERTEGWVTGLRLAAMSMERHESPRRFVAEFAGSERTVADYLLGEVLLRQPPEVRDLLLRTCILERVDGELADVLTGRHDGARLLHELAEANALVVAVDVARSAYRYHHLLLDLLRLELRRELPGEVPELHRRAARWYADRDRPVEAVRHASRAGDWTLAAELLGRHWVELLLDGEEATLSALVGGIPLSVVEVDAEVATILAADRLRHERWAEAEALLTAAGARIGDLPEPRRGRARTTWAAVQLLHARHVGGVDDVVEASTTLAEHLGTAEQAGADLEGLARFNLGVAEAWTFRFEEAERDLERGLALGRTTGRPYIEIGCLAGLGNVATLSDRVDRGERLLRDAVAVAQRVGWSSHPLAGGAYMGLAATLVDRGMLAECEQWVARAEPILADAGEPSASVGLRHVQGMLGMIRGRYADARDAFRDGERLAEVLRAPHGLAAIERPWQLRARLALGELDAVRAELATAPSGHQTAEWCNLAARLHLLEGDAAAVLRDVAPVLSGEARALHTNFLIEAHLLQALAQRALGDVAGAESSTEAALALSEPRGNVGMVLTVPGAGDLLRDHPVHRTAHGAHLQLLRDLLAGVEPEPTAAAATLQEPLKERELAVLRFLSTNLTAAEIGDQLFLSVHTVKTHMRKLYAKMGVHTRAEAVQQGRALGLLAPARRSH